MTVVMENIVECVVNIFWIGIAQRESANRVKMHILKQSQTPTKHWMSYVEWRMKDRHQRLTKNKSVVSLNHAQRITFSQI